jgi:hypothetical protein
MSAHRLGHARTLISFGYDPGCSTTTLVVALLSAKVVEINQALVVPPTKKTIRLLFMICTAATNQWVRCSNNEKSSRVGDSSDLSSRPAAQATERNTMTIGVLVEWHVKPKDEIARAKALLQETFAGTVNYPGCQRYM